RHTGYVARSISRVGRKPGHVRIERAGSYKRSESRELCFNRTHLEEGRPASGNDSNGAANRTAAKLDQPGIVYLWTCRPRRRLKPGRTDAVVSSRKGPGRQFRS